MKNKKKKNRWRRFRHGLSKNLIRFFISGYSKFKYGIKVEKFKNQGKRPYLILYNHQTSFDQFFVGMVIKGTIYYVASEDIFSNGFTSKIIKYLVAPIPIKKQTTDTRATMNCIKVAREGYSIAIAPEGNRTFSGKTEYINPAIAKLAKMIKLPIAFLRIEGGYGVQPRWSNVKRKGKMRAFVSRVIEPEEFLSLDDDSLNKLINDELYVFEANENAKFYHKKSAEYLERTVYVCPTCGLSTFISKNDTIECKQCGLKARYSPTTKLLGVDKPFPFEFVNDWYEYQCDFVNKLTLSDLDDKLLYTDKVKFSQVILYKKKKVLYKDATASLYGNKIVIEKDGAVLNYDFSKISAISVLGKNKVNFYIDDNVYQIKGDVRFNALRYVNLYYRRKNIIGGREDGKFLGL